MLLQFLKSLMRPGLNTNLPNRLFACMFLLLTLASGEASAQQPPLKLGIATVPPFVMQAEDGHWEGISIDLWQQVADGMNLDFEWVPMEFRELLDAVEKKEIDVAVGALTILPGIFAEQLYALALPDGSKLREPVSENILRVTESADWEDVLRSYLGTK